MGLLFAFVVWAICVGAGMHPLVALLVGLVGGFLLGGGMHVLGNRRDDGR